MNKFNYLLKNISYSISSNLLSFFVSIVITLVVPKFIGVEEYGYWQLYLFYSLYVGFLHFGWIDGIYLRYGGKHYEQLDKGLFFSQFVMLLALQFFIGLLIIFLSIYKITDINRQFIVLMVAIELVIINMRWLLIYILQATNRIKEYAIITIVGRILFIVLAIISLVLGFRSFELLIIADIVGKLISFLVAVYFTKDIVFNRISLFYFSIREVLENIKVGMNLMFSTIASMLIIGIIRLGIERFWDISTFGKISLTLSISNMMMVFINAVGVVLFPMLRRTSYDKLSNIYSKLRISLMPVVFAFLLLYYPVKELLVFWLPKYADSLNYMALLLPICVFEGKMALLINTYLKNLREEKFMLRVNLITLAFSVLLTAIFTLLFNNLNLLVFSIVFLLAFRAVYAELYLSKKINILVKKDILMELILTLIFIYSGWFINSWNTLLIYGIGYVTYLLVKRKDLLELISSVVRLK
ncbi:MAG: oligosaccharide flippase family protein [Salinivirgaceae bacterium]